MLFPVLYLVRASSFGGSPSCARLAHSEADLPRGEPIVIVREGSNEGELAAVVSALAVVWR